MTLGSTWKANLEAAAEIDRIKNQELQEAAIKRRAANIINNIQENLPKCAQNSFYVMELASQDCGEGVTFDDLRNKDYHDYSCLDRFAGAAKIVVEYCLSQDLVVTVCEEDFSMTSGSIGAEIWVSPKE